MGEELIPFPGGEVAVLLAGPFGPAAVMNARCVRDVLGVDRGVTHRGVHSGMAADLGRDLRGAARADGVGDEDPPRIVGGHCSGWPAAVICAACDVATRHSRMQRVFCIDDEGVA
jgi:hypothetical protein